MRGASLDTDVGEAHDVMGASPEPRQEQGGHYHVLSLLRINPSRFRSSGILPKTPPRTSTPFSVCLSLVHFLERILLRCSSPRPLPAHQTNALRGLLTFATCVPKPVVEHAAGWSTESAFEQDIPIMIEDPRGGIPHKDMSPGMVIVKTACPSRIPALYSG